MTCIAIWLTIPAVLNIISKSFLFKQMPHFKFPVFPSFKHMTSAFRNEEVKGSHCSAFCVPTYCRTCIRAI